MLNKVMLIGRLGRDPEIRYTQSGNAVAAFSIATSEFWRDKQGQKQEKTEWHDISAWDRLADQAQSYLRKGSMVYVEGKLQTRSWEDQQGQKRQKTEVVANQIRFLDSRDSNRDNVREGSVSSGGGAYGGGNTYAPSAPASPPPGAPAGAGPAGPEAPYVEDDVPF